MIITRRLGGWATLGLLALAACHPKPREITPLQRKEAASLESEAQFAVTIKDHARAAELYAKAAELCPDEPEYSLGLGASRARLNDRAGAKKAYEAVLAIYQAARAQNRQDARSLFQEAYVLALLGRKEEAREALKKAGAASGGNSAAEGSAEQALERLMADPAFKAVAL